MRVHEKRAWADGDTVTGEELNAEFNHMFGALNGSLDRDNVLTGLITAAKIRNDTCNILEAVSSIVTTAVTRGPQDNPQNWYDVPEMSFSMTTDDGRIKIEAELHGSILRNGIVPVAPDPSPDFDLGIMVDNDLVARTDIDGAVKDNSKAVMVDVPVGVGVHAIRMVIRIAPSRDPSDTLIHGVNCRGRILFARFQRR